MREIMEGHPMHFVFPSCQWMTGTGACPDTEVQAPTRHHINRGGDLRQHRWRPEAVAGDQQAKPHALRLGCKR